MSRFQSFTRTGHWPTRFASCLCFDTCCAGLRVARLYAGAGASRSDA